MSEFGDVFKMLGTEVAAIKVGIVDGDKDRVKKGIRNVEAYARVLHELVGIWESKATEAPASKSTEGSPG